ncbi:hypothetical protein AK812_SmicGene36261 [Symbiodinium microadriaticum]|uniref:Uncharacterized protein n=1 Tax=Symbiodinium microadriaticum TaxID=2951 RepID=A0A1Q9CJF5_SYMMI|nr:hypothetical protein AK812_SmicGene36261 [Symbiodinium microadriaticum]
MAIRAAAAPATELAGASRAAQAAGFYQGTIGWHAVPTACALALAVRRKESRGLASEPFANERLRALHAGGWHAVPTACALALAVRRKESRGRSVPWQTGLASEPFANERLRALHAGGGPRDVGPGKWEVL